MYGWEYAQWRRPYLLVESQPDRLILELPKFSILPEETLISLRNLFGNKVDLLGKDELNILAICDIEGEVNNNRLQDSIDKHRSDITKILQELCKEGFLISENKSRWTTYHLNTNFANNVESEIDTKVDTSEQKVDSSKQKVGSSETLTPNLDTSIQKVDSSIEKVGSSEQKVDSSETLTPNLDTLTPNLDTSVKKNARKLSKEQLNSLIINTCKSDFITIEQIALRVKRSQAYLQNEVLPYLVNNAKLVRQYPENPNHPNQAYKAADKQ
jgi:predicted transcriptional regulator